MKFSKSMFGKAAAVALVLAAAGGAAHARSNVYFSVGANVAPGVSVGVSNYGGYYPYAAPAYPVYYQPAPVYYPAPVVYSAPVYYVPSRVYYGKHHRRHHGYARPVAYVRY